jgi:hypothetical protein
MGRFSITDSAAARTIARFQGGQSFGGVKIDAEGALTYKGVKQSGEGAQAHVETAGQISERISATRMLLTGPFAFALKKKKDDRELYLTIEGSVATWVVSVNPKEGAKAREFAAKINTLGRGL